MKNEATAHARTALPRAAPRGAELRRPWPEPAATPRLSFPAPAARAPLRIAAERSSFLTEARVPLADAWGGRLRLAGVQQRFHAANLYSVLSPSFFAEAAVAPGAASIVGCPRVNYGVGLQLRF